MDTYCFILGKNPILSLAEYFHYEERQGLSSTIRDLTRHALVVEGSTRDLAAWQRDLGGMVKTGTVITTVSDIAALRTTLNAQYLRKNIFAQEDKKIVFGFSLHGPTAYQHFKEFNALGLKIKKDLQQDGYSCRFVQADDGKLSSVQVEKNKLITKGGEILIIMGIHGIHIAVTRTVQDFENFSERDYDRPSRDTRSGMIPPKLAKIMINMSGATTDQHLLDPFCGSGTIIQESLLMGWQEVTGTDISEKAIVDTRDNIAWLQQRGDKISDATLDVLDVSKLTDKIEINSIDTIVTEPYLGPPIRTEPEVIEMLTIIQELETLYLAAFRSFAQVLKYGGRIVIVFPLFKTRHGIYSLKILETLQAMGFHRVSPLPDNLSLFAKIGPTARGSLIYSREGQSVQREIFIFELKKAET